ncbi:MAG TPA: FG-GAP-like repeat-containing protein [Pyrinomonadaceae bacterium]
MNKKLVIGILSILALFTSASFINLVSAEDNSAASASQLSNTIVISQVYGGGGSNNAGPTYKPDYVELFNRSNSPQSLNGSALQYGSSTGQFGSSATNIFALPDVTLQPGQYFLVQLGTVGTAGADLPVTPDAVTTNLSMSGTSGKVALTNTTTALGCGATATPCALPDPRIIDLVAYGEANNAEGGASVNNGTALTNTQGSVRKGNGCTETDNNNNDFTVVTNPIPRNRASALAPCSGGGTPTPTPTATPTPSVTPTPTATATPNAPVDFNGDGRTDYVVVRNVGGTGGAPVNQARWFYNINGSSAATVALDWGLASTDIFLSEDFDGDRKDDITVWRPGAPGVAAFYILNSATNTVRIERFGQTDDDPTVVGDYDGDGKADVAVYREGANANAQSIWFYRTTPGGPTFYIPWGLGGDIPAPGDYDGDNRNDFVIQRGNNLGQGIFWTRLATGTVLPVQVFGQRTDFIVPGDYDGDRKTDLAVARIIENTTTQWFWKRSSDGVFVGPIPFGNPNDLTVQGDYDGDGRTDIAVWRSNGQFIWRSTTSGAVMFFGLGASGDFPVANFNTH